MPRLKDEDIQEAFTCMLAVQESMEDDIAGLGGKLRSMNKRIKALEELVLRMVDDGR